jgi:hypothetical protein
MDKHVERFIGTPRITHHVMILHVPSAFAKSRLPNDLDHEEVTGMNIYLSMILAAALAVFGGASAMSETNQPQHSQGQTAGSYQLVQPPYSEALQPVYKQVREAGGYQVVHADEQTYVVIGLGQRPTGGYSLQVDKVEQSADGTWQVYVHESKPAPGSMTTQVLTYPTVVVSLPKADAQAKVVFTS